MNFVCNALCVELRIRYTNSKSFLCCEYLTNTKKHDTICKTGCSAAGSAPALGVLLRVDDRLALLTIFPCGSGTFSLAVFPILRVKACLTTVLTTTATIPFSASISYPGLAKFGIALGLGPRDRGFESRSPDQNPEFVECKFWIFLCL